MRNKKTGRFKKFSLGFRIKLAFAKWYEENKYLIASFVWGLLLGLLLGFGLFTPKTSPQALSNKIEVKADEVTPTPKPLNWNDAIRQVFPADEAGKMIRICLKESGWYSGKPSYNNDGSYDYGPCQVNSCHKPKSMTDSEWMKYLDDPVNHANEVRKVYLSQGWGAWVVFNKGLAK